MPKALIVVTSASDLGGHKTGYWLEEVAAPFHVFRAAGFEVDIASPQGGSPPLDSASVAESFLTEDTKTFEADAAAKAKLEGTLKLGDVDAASYDVIFAAGGHGTAVDFPNNPVVNNALAAVYNAGGIVSAVCHGPMSFVGVEIDGKPLVSGKKVTAFTNEEEDAVNLSDKVPFLLETKLRELGGVYEKVAPWHPHAVADGRLVSGQNPQSSKVTAEKVVEVFKSN